MFDFDEVIDRTGTNSLKVDFKEERGIPEDALPLWVADMDFRTVPEVVDALEKTARHGIYGYSDSKEGYDEAVLAWFKDHFGYDAEKEWIVKTPGVVFAIAQAVRAFTKPGDAVLIQPPVYYPFEMTIRGNDRIPVCNELVLQDGRYSIDFDDFERKIIENDVKLFILCSPHNPVGRVWTREELHRMGEILEKHGVLTVSDEIHADFAFSEHPHTVFTEAAPGMRDLSIICTAPSKSFNLAGLNTSNIFIENPKLRHAFEKEVLSGGVSQLNIFGLAATEAAYRNGETWLSEVRDYMRGNLDYIRAFLDKNIPEIKLIEPEGTYFAWLDCSGLGLSDKALNELILQDAKLWLDPGNIFGKSGEQFERVVLASPRSVIEEAMERLRKAIDLKKSS